MGGLTHIMHSSKLPDSVSNVFTCYVFLLTKSGEVCVAAAALGTPLGCTLCMPR